MSKERIPSFLEHVEVDSSDITKCSEILRNWMVTHGYITKLKPSETSLQVLRRLMVVEYIRQGGPRMDIIVRLHGKMCKLRYEVERVELRA